MLTAGQARPVAAARGGEPDGDGSRASTVSGG
jgi:hypothetical protein